MFKLIIHAFSHGLPLQAWNINDRRRINLVSLFLSDYNPQACSHAHVYLCPGDEVWGHHQEFVHTRIDARARTHTRSHSSSCLPLALVYCLIALEYVHIFTCAERVAIHYTLHSSTVGVLYSAQRGGEVGFFLAWGGWRWHLFVILISWGSSFAHLFAKKSFRQAKKC